MSITETLEKCKNAVPTIPRDILIMLILIVSSGASFALGYLAGRDEGQGSDQMAVSQTAIEATTTGLFVASKSGTKYYHAQCAGARRIAPDNKVWFATAAAAVSAGYAPATTCREY